MNFPWHIVKTRKYPMNFGKLIDKREEEMEKNGNFEIAKAKYLKKLEIQLHHNICHILLWNFPTTTTKKI